MSRLKQDNLRYQIRDRTFYNQDLKEEYLTYLSDRGTSIEDMIRSEKMFEVLKKTEEAVGKDACSFSQAEAERAFSRFEDVVQTKFTLINRIRRYVRWCRKIGVEGACDGFFEFTPDRESYKKTKASNPKGVQVILKALEDADEDGKQKFGPHFRLYVWLLYAGMTPELIDRIEAGNFSIPDLTVSYDEDRQFRLERESLEDLTAVLSAELKDIPLMLPEGSSYMQLPSHWYLRRAHDAAKKCPFDFYPQNILLCGLFYRMWENETFLSGALNFGFLSEEARRMGILFRTEKNLAADFKEQYERWKCAFWLL